MRIPRGISGAELITALGRVGYQVTRQTGSHVRLTRTAGGEHHITVPDHRQIKIGTLNSILRDVADHLGMERGELIERLFG